MGGAPVLAHQHFFFYQMWNVKAGGLAVSAALGTTSDPAGAQASLRHNGAQLESREEQGGKLHRAFPSSSIKTSRE